jgi:hypothetical protein
MDDFYILDSGLVVTETSNDIFDQSLYRKVVPQAALSWQRVLVANWLSKDGPEWAHWVAQHNSGMVQGFGLLDAGWSRVVMNQALCTTLQLGHQCAPCCPSAGCRLSLIGAPHTCTAHQHAHWAGSKLCTSSTAAAGAD